jgi:predicted O-methyltransferase YrrM
MLAAVKKLVPPSIARPIKIARDRMFLGRLAPIPCDATPLGRMDDLIPKEVFANARFAEEWESLQPDLQDLGIHERAGGVNPGDRRVIFCLVRHLKPKSFLEVGTHIGASTVHVASAMRMGHPDPGETPIRLDTVDIRDVNDERTQPWRQFGSTHSPRQMTVKLGVDHFVDFHADTSLNYLATCERTYDMIFLDGDHTGPTVYREIPAALTRLNPGGYILLHDFFPGLKPLWPGGAFAAGPVLATERLAGEGAPIKVLPLGELPWPTKMGSNLTSLALLGAA